VQGSHIHLRAYLWLIFILIAIAGFLYALYAFEIVLSRPEQPSSATLTSTFPQNMPAPTTADVVSAQQSFQYLVSYTVSGFHPTVLSINSGETVRFVNNSPDQITIEGTAIASSMLSQGANWQYTAASAGTLTFKAGYSTLTVTVMK
jgi:plastocyanin